MPNYHTQITSEDGVSSMQLRFTPSWAYIRPVRVFVSDYCFLAVNDGDLASELTLVVTELLENAVKNSLDSVVFVQVDIDDQKHEALVDAVTPTG